MSDRDHDSSWLQELLVEHPPTVSSPPMQFQSHAHPGRLTDGRPWRYGSASPPNSLHGMTTGTRTALVYDAGLGRRNIDTIEAFAFSSTSPTRDEMDTDEVDEFAPTQVLHLSPESPRAGTPRPQDKVKSQDDTPIYDRFLRDFPETARDIAKCFSCGRFTLALDPRDAVAGPLIQCKLQSLSLTSAWHNLDEVYTVCRDCFKKPMTQHALHRCDECHLCVPSIAYKDVKSIKVYCRVCHDKQAALSIALSGPDVSLYDRLVRDFPETTRPLGVCESCGRETHVDDPTHKALRVEGPMIQLTRASWSMAFPGPGIDITLCRDCINNKPAVRLLLLPCGECKLLVPSISNETSSIVCRHCFAKYEKVSLSLSLHSRLHTLPR